MTWGPCDSKASYTADTFRRIQIQHANLFQILQLPSLPTKVILPNKVKSENQSETTIKVCYIMAHCGINIQQ